MGKRRDNRDYIMQQLKDPENQELIFEALIEKNSTAQLKLNSSMELQILVMRGRILNKRQ